jgi:hypothetical protein
MTLDTFLSLIKSNSAILYPACLIQTKLRTKICGMNFWTRIERLREKLFGEEYVTVEMILRLEGKRELIDEEMRENAKRQEKL